MSCQSYRGVAACALAALLALPARADDLLALDRVFADVDAANPSLAASRDEAEAARARARRAGAWEPPMLELAAENVPAGGGFDRDPMTMRVVGLEQPLDVFGSRRIARDAARSEARAVEADAAEARWDRFADAWMAFADAFFAGARAQEAREHQHVMDRMSAAARARYESGRGRLDELFRAEAERARLVADAARFQAIERAARARLDALRGRESGVDPEPLAAPPEWLAPDSASGWREAVAAHPRVRALAEREAGRLGQARAARRAAWPELRLRASYGFRATLFPGTPQALPQDDMWSAGVGLALPLGTGTRQGAEAAEMTAMARAARAERQGATLGLTSELAGLRGQAIASRRAVSLLMDTVMVAQGRALEAAWSAYESGTADLAAVLDAAHASYTTELEVLEARRELADTLARLLAASARPDLVGVRVPEPGGDRRQP